MVTLLNFMEKLYSDTKALSIVYIVGSILLFIFIVMLIISLRKPNKKETKIIEEPNIENNEKKNLETIEENKINETTENANEEILIKHENIEEETNNKENNIISELKEDNNKKETSINKEDTKKVVEPVNTISSEIPNIDDYVDNIVSKTYEKNEQFSSVYVNTDTIKLEKVLDNLNVDKSIKEEIVPESEKVEKNELISEPIIENKEETKEEVNNIDKLENLKKSLEEKRANINDKQNDLKNKLDALKNNNTNKLDDLKSKLDNLKSQ